jgi:DNA mismatch repair protein MutS2
LEGKLNKHTLSILEFDRIQESLACQCRTEGGRLLASKIQPIADFDTVELAQNETSQSRNFIEKFGMLPLTQVRSISNILKMTIIGSRVSPKDLLDVLSTLKASRIIRQSLEVNKDLVADIWSVAQRIRPQPQIEQLIIKTVDEYGEVLDSASDRLASIRVQMKLVHTKIHSKLGEVLKTSSYSKMIQEPIITIRDDRFVIPLKGEYRNHFPCIVHDSSASGQTLYVEPLSVIPLNNDLRNLRQREEEEIGLIMDNITREISFKSADLELLDDTLSIIDLIFARGELSINWKCSRPALDKKPKFNIIHGRHPLLNVEPVPIDAKIGEDYRAIILTGPNTGGKTVTLKTIGLFIAMTQCGLHLPANEDTSMGIFMDVLADIGDEQSISQNLSTFSSHLTNIKEILSETDTDKLIMLDELGAGTDPLEGAALAYSVTEHLYQIGCKFIITTHIGDLKAFAYKNPQSVNASVGFDSETLRPTFKIHIGTPGASHAFDIAQRIGIPESIIEYAKTLISKEDRDSTEIVARMAEDARLINEERKQVVRAKNEADELLKKREIELEEFESSKSKMIDRELSKAKRFFNEKLEEANEIVKRLAQATRQSKETDTLHKRLQEISSEIRQETPSTPENEFKTIPAEIDGIKPGDVVFVPKFKSQGFVMDVFPDKGKVLVQVGSARVQLPANTVELVIEGEIVKAEKQTEERPKIETVQIKLELFGMPIEDALLQLERHLDKAFAASVPYIYVVHGRGSGALRKAISEYLSKNTNVDRFNLANPNEGGDAVTIVFLK